MTERRPYNGLPKVHFPGGADVTIAQFSCGHRRRMPVVAVLGINGHEARDWLAWEMMADHNTDPSEEVLWAAMLLFYCHRSHADGKTELKWPVTDDNGCLTADRRRDRQLVYEVHPESFEDEVLIPAYRLTANLPTEKAPPLYGAMLQTVLDAYPNKGADAGAVADAALWNVPRHEYGDPSPEAISAVKARALELADTFRDALRGPNPLNAVSHLQSEIDECREQDDVHRLAAWLQVLMAGSRAIDEWVRQFQQLILDEVTEHSVAENLPQQLRVAWDEGKGLHRLLYESVPEFAFGSWYWYAKGPKEPRLVSPLLVGIARAQLGKQWWNELESAFADSNEVQIQSALGRMRRLNRLLAEWRLIGRSDVWPKENARAKKKDIDPVFVQLDEVSSLVDEDSKSDPADRSVDISEVRARMAQVLAPRDEKVWRRINIEGEPSAEVAEDLGVSRPRISQINKRAFKKLGADPYLKALFDNL